MEVYMHRHRAILFGVILSLSAGANIGASAPGCLDLADFRAAASKQHNVHRAKHDVPPLVLSSQLNDVAQHYAEQLARTNRLVHSGNTHFGENLYAFGSSGQTLPLPEAVVDRWYSEIQNYNFGLDHGIGHLAFMSPQKSERLTPHRG
jgi:Cysteine-rich secretory protein family